jgi:hypothetical protein
MGYFNGAYTIAPFLDEDTVIGGYGIVKKNNYAISGMASDVAERVYAYFYTPSTGYRDILDGNMIYGYVYARMGYEYYSSGEEIREFIDAGQLAPPGIGADTLETFKAAMRIPASEEYLRRWTALEQDARRLHDEKLFAEMQDIERQAAIQKEQQLEQRERAWRAAHQNPPPPSFSPSQVPAQPWTPPPLPSFTAPSQPIVVPYRAPPPPQLYWGHPQGGSGECEDCNDDTNNGGGSIDLGPPT